MHEEKMLFKKPNLLQAQYVKKSEQQIMQISAGLELGMSKKKASMLHHWTTITAQNKYCGSFHLETSSSQTQSADSSDLQHFRISNKFLAKFDENDTASGTPLGSLENDKIKTLALIDRRQTSLQLILEGVGSNLGWMHVKCSVKKPQRS